MKKLLLIALLILTGCVSQGANILRYDQTTRQAKPTDYSIEILDRENIDREYKVIAQVSDAITNVYESEQLIMNNLLNAARKLGGDALIDLETETIDTSYDWIPSKETIYKAKVIVFTE